MSQLSDEQMDLATVPGEDPSPAGTPTEGSGAPEPGGPPPRPRPGHPTVCAACLCNSGHDVDCPRGTTKADLVRSSGASSKD
ncbi:hypothetical protein GCM10027600_01280 [Nocardioides ginsengisegetis]